MGEHTKTPWRAEEPRSYAGVKWDCIIRAADNSPVCIVTVAGFPGKEAKANAAFIVKAVNNHEALVKALKEAREALLTLDHGSDSGLGVVRGGKPIRDIIDAALTPVVGTVNRTEGGR